MNTAAAIKIHWSFWLLSAFALLWNLGGSINYFMQTNLEFVSTLPETHKAIIIGRPLWATAGFALGVFGGSLGAILLLFKKYLAFYLFIASLGGILLTMIHTVKVVNSTGLFNMSEIFVMVVLPVLTATFLIWYANMAKSKSWVS